MWASIAMKVHRSEDSLNGSSDLESDELSLGDFNGSFSSLSLVCTRPPPSQDKRTQLPASLFYGQKQPKQLLSKSKLVDYGMRPAGSKSMTDLNAPFTTLPGLTPQKSTFSLADSRGRSMSSMVNARFTSKRRTTNSHSPKSVRSRTCLDFNASLSVRSCVSSSSTTKEDRERLTKYVDKALQEITKKPDAKEKELIRGRSLFASQRLSASCNGTSPRRPKPLSERGRAVSLGDTLTSSFKRSTTLSPKPFPRQPSLVDKRIIRSRSGSRPRMYDPEKMIQSVDNALAVFDTSLEGDASTTTNNTQLETENPEIKFQLKTSILSPKRASDPMDETMRSSRREKLIDMLEMDELSKPDLNRDSLCASFRAVSAAGMTLSKSTRGNSSPDLFFNLSHGDDKDHSRRRSTKQDNPPIPMPPLNRSRSAPFDKTNPQRSFQALAALAGKSSPFHDSTLSFVSTDKQDKAEFNALAALSGKGSVSSKRSCGLLSGHTINCIDPPASTPRVPDSIATLKRNESFMSGASSIGLQSQTDPLSPRTTQFNESMVGKELSIRAFPPPLPKTSLNRARSAPLNAAGNRSSTSPIPFQPKNRSSGSFGMLSDMDDSIASLSFLKEEDGGEIKTVRKTPNARPHQPLMIQTSTKAADLLEDESEVQTKDTATSAASRHPLRRNKSMDSSSLTDSNRRRPLRRNTSREAILMLDSSMKDGSSRRRPTRRITSRDSLLDGNGFDVNAMALRRTTMRRVTSRGDPTATPDVSCGNGLGSGPPIGSSGRRTTVRRVASTADAGLAGGMRRRNASGVGFARGKRSPEEQVRSNAIWQSTGAANRGRDSVQARGKSNAVWESRGAKSRQNSSQAVGKSNALWESKRSTSNPNALQRVVTIR